MRVTNDRRRKPRVRLGGAAVVHGGGTPLQCECIDLAIGGVGLQSDVKIKRGRKVTVVLSLGAQAVTVPAVVKRCRAQKRGWLLGLQFLGLDAAGAALLEAFVEGALHRDVRLYQAQVFLARTGAKSLEEALGSKGPLEGGTPMAQGDVPTTHRRTPTAPWAPGAASAPPEPSPSAHARTPDPPPEPPARPTLPVLPPQASAALRHAVANALNETRDEIGAPDGAVSSTAGARTIASAPIGYGDFGDAPAKGGTMIRRNPLLDAPSADIPTLSRKTLAPPSAVLTRPGVRVPATASPPTVPSPFSADVSGLDFDDAHGSDGRPGRRTTVVDPRKLAAPPAGVRPPPLRVERTAAPSISFVPEIADLDLDDTPTQTFPDGPPRPPEPEPAIGHRARRGETQIGPAPRPDSSQHFDTPPSPFGGGQARSAGPPMRPASTRTHTQVPAEDPTPLPIPGRDDMRPAPTNAQTGVTQVAIQAPRAMLYGPVRGEATQVSIPAGGLPYARATEDDTTDVGTRPGFVSEDETAARPRGHPRGAAKHEIPDAAHGDEDPEFAAQYGRALADLDLESR